jgi:hypothetical protein
MLGDTIETIEKHYTPFVKELRDRVRNILETGTGIEEATKMLSVAGKHSHGKPNWQQKFKIRRKHAKAGVCLKSFLVKWCDISRGFCHNLATIAEQHRLIFQIFYGG